jgi:hypothetical protein
MSPVYTPPRGYWARKRSGYKVDRPPLPAFVSKEKLKPKPPEPEVQKPVGKKANPSSAWEDRQKKIKQILRDHRSRLSAGVHYTVIVDSWSCDYSFGLNSMFDPLRPYKNIMDSIHREPFKEYRWLIFRGQFLEPPQLKEQKVEVRLSQDAYLNEAIRDKNLHLYEENPPNSVGFLEKNKSRSQCHVWFPKMPCISSLRPPQPIK